MTKRKEPPSPGKGGRIDRAKKRAPDFFDGGEVVKFIIGKTAKELIVHKAFACYHSPVFDAAFNSNFIEGQTQTYTMDDTTVEAFVFLMQWMYTGAIKIPILQKGSEGITSEEANHESSEGEEEDKYLDGGSSNKAQTSDSQDPDLVPGFAPEETDYDESGIEIDSNVPEMPHLLRLWVLADKLAMPKLQNYVMDRIGEATWLEDYIPVHSLYYVYDNTSDSSPLRKFLVDQCVCGFGIPQHCDAKNLYPPEMLFDMVKSYSKQESIRYVGDVKPTSEFHVAADS